MPQTGMVCGIVARPAGFEPTAYRLGGGRSILLSYGRTALVIIPKPAPVCKALAFDKNGASIFGSAIWDYSFCSFSNTGSLSSVAK